MRQPGCLVFLTHNLRATGGPYSLHPPVIVSSGSQRLQGNGMQRPANCVVVQPIVVQTEAEGRTTSGRRSAFREDSPCQRGGRPSHRLQEHLARTPYAGLARRWRRPWAMLQAIDLMRERCEPPRTFLVMWNQLAPGLPVALFHPWE